MYRKVTNFMKANTRMIKDMDMVFLGGMTVANTLDTGPMVSSTDQVCSTNKLISSHNMVYGKTAKS